jgi:hypothetical protein
MWINSRSESRTAPGASPLHQAAFAALLLLALVFTLEPVQEPVRVGALVAFSPVEMLLVLGVGLWLLARLVTRTVPAIPRSLAVPAVLWLGVLLLAALLAPDHRLHSLKFVSRMLNLLLIVWATYDLARVPWRWQALARALALSAALVGLLGVAEALALEPVAGWLMTFKRGVARAGDMVRISSTLSYPTITAAVLELTAPLLLAWIITTRRRALRVLLALALLACMATMVLTLSRAGVVLLGLSFLAMAVISLRFGHALHARATLAAATVAAATLAAITAGMFFLNPLVQLRLLSETEQGWYQASYTAGEVRYLRPEESARVPVRVQNTGVRTWSATGTAPFLLSYHLLRANGDLYQYDGARTPLPEDVPPGAALTVQALLVAPPVSGQYLVEWDMLQEGVTWFSWKGAQALRVPLVVSGAAVTVQETPVIAPPPVVRIPTPDRMTLWRAAGRMVLERPLLGIGPGVFRLSYGDFLAMPVSDPNIHTNNLYIEWLVGAGLPGLLAFLWLSWRLWRLARRALGPVDEQWIWGVALAVGLFSWYLHGLLDFFFEFTPTYVAFAFVAGLLASGPSGSDAS